MTLVFNPLSYVKYLLSQLSVSSPEDDWKYHVDDVGQVIISSKPLRMEISLEADKINRDRGRFTVIIENPPFWYEGDLPSCTFDPSKSFHLIRRDLYRKVIAKTGDLRKEWAGQALMAEQRDRQAHETADHLSGIIPGARTHETGRSICMEGTIGGRHGVLVVDRITGRVEIPALTLNSSDAIRFLEELEDVKWK